MERNKFLFYLVHVKEELLHSQCRFSTTASSELCPALDKDSTFLKGHQTLPWDILWCSWEFPSQQDKRRKLRIPARQGAGPGACCALHTVCHGKGTHLQLYLCSLCPQPLDMGHGSSIFFSLLGTKGGRKDLPVHQFFQIITQEFSADASDWRSFRSWICSAIKPQLQEELIILLPMSSLLTSKWDLLLPYSVEYGAL